MIIYIIGYGRSGTTSLARQLEDKLNAINLGELKYLYRKDKDDLIDPFWANFKAQNKELLEDESSRLIKFDNILGFLRWSHRQKFKNLWDEFFRKIGVDPEKDILIDSSKSNLDAFMRGIYLYHSYKNVVFVKPERSAIAILKSLLKGKNSNLERGVRKGRGARILHTAAIGLPHFLITELLSYFYQCYGVKVVDLKNLESEADKFIEEHNIKKNSSKKNIPMYYGNRSRINSSS